MLHYFKEQTGYLLLDKLKEEAPDRTLWSKLFGTGYEPVVKQAMEIR